MVLNVLVMKDWEWLTVYGLLNAKVKNLAPPTFCQEADLTVTLLLKTILSVERCHVYGVVQLTARKVTWSKGTLSFTSNSQTHSLNLYWVRNISRSHRPITFEASVRLTCSYNFAVIVVFVWNNDRSTCGYRDRFVDITLVIYNTKVKP